MNNNNNNYKLILLRDGRNILVSNEKLLLNDQCIDIIANQIFKISDNEFEEPIEAYEATIEYTLNNLL